MSRLSHEHPEDWEDIIDRMSDIRDDDIVRIPPTDNHLGSCPECGKSIWASYLIRSNPLVAVYRCIECKGEIKQHDIIPF